jgi:hypothetical protein
MSKAPVYRNGKEIHPVRQFLRNAIPRGEEGCVVEDCDLILRRYGPRYGLDQIGRFKLCEMKYGKRTPLEYAQQMTFASMDYVLRSSKEKWRYEGFFLVHYEGRDHEGYPTWYWVNGESLRPQGFAKWAEGHIVIKPKSLEHLLASWSVAS